MFQWSMRNPTTDTVYLRLQLLRQSTRMQYELPREYDPLLRLLYQCLRL